MSGKEPGSSEFDRWQDVVAEGALAPQDIRLLATD